MPTPENIIPPKKGEVRNPNGKPKGTRNRSTIVREWLEVTQKLKNPITGENEELSQADMITLALISKARKGDVAAFKELMDSGFGKNPDIINSSVQVKEYQQLTKEQIDKAIEEL